MVKNAFAYVTRKSLKSIIILLVVLAMSTLCLISLAIKDATDRASEELSLLLIICGLGMFFLNGSLLFW